MENDENILFTVSALPQSRQADLLKTLGVPPKRLASLTSHPIEVQIHDGRAYVWLTELLELPSDELMSALAVTGAHTEGKRSEPSGARRNPLCPKR